MVAQHRSHPVSGESPFSMTITNELEDPLPRIITLEYLRMTIASIEESSVVYRLYASRRQEQKTLRRTLTTLAHFRGCKVSNASFYQVSTLGSSPI
jgi:hypothetical protein